MKLYFAEAYTLKEDNWAAEIIGYSAEQLPNNEPPGSCPKNRQNRLKEKGPTEERSSTGTKPAPTEAREDTPSGGQRYRAGPVSLVRRSGRAEIPRPPAAQAADKRRNTVTCCRPCSGLLILSPKYSSETVPFAKEPLLQSSRRYPDLAGDKKKVRPYDLTLKRRLPTLPRENRSTIGVSELNFSVRNGKRWNLTAITT